MPRPVPVEPCLADETGISLLEVLVSVVLILLTVPFMVALEVHALKLNADAGEIDLATWVAQAKVEELRADAYDDVKKGDTEFVLPDGRRFEVTWDVKKGKPVKDTMTITVTALELDNVDARSAEIVFVLAKREQLSCAEGSGSGSEDDGCGGDDDDD